MSLYYDKFDLVNLMLDINDICYNNVLYDSLVFYLFFIGLLANIAVSHSTVPVASNLSLLLHTMKQYHCSKSILNN